VSGIAEKTLLPNLLIIGAMKCGTTSLHRYLDQHPEIAMSTEKEPLVFKDDDFLDRLEWYSSLFTEAPVRGEATTGYTAYPLAPGVPERIHSLIPDVKMIYLVGDPLKRIEAHWVWSYHTQEDLHPQAIHAKKVAGRPLLEGLQDFDDPYNFYVARSRYATQLEQYLEFFPAAQILVLDQSDLRARTTETLREAFAFLGVDDTFESEAFTRRHNVGVDRRRRVTGYSKIRRRAMAFGLERVPERFRRPIGRRVGRIFSRQVERPQLDTETLPGLTELLREEANRLRELTGKPFASWSV
jgi:hypothetical protein